MDWQQALIVFAVSGLPVVEMRLAVGLGLLHYHMGLPATFILTVAGNLIVIPFVWNNLPPFERLCRRSRRLNQWLDWLYAKTRHEVGQRRTALGGFGLFVIVALTGVPFPLPGTS